MDFASALQPHFGRPRGKSGVTHKKKKKGKGKKRRRGGVVHNVGDSARSVRISKEDHDLVLRGLREISWEEARNTSRRNVIRDDTPRTQSGRPYCQSFIFGKNMKDPAGAMSWWSTAFPDQYEQLCALIKKYCPGFKFTHITLNRNLRCKRHRDRGNAGPSLICGFGPFQGGKLIVENPTTGEEVAHDVRRRLVSFNGAKQPHETAPYTGERYTCVWYTSTISPAGGTAIDSGSGGGTRSRSNNEDGNVEEDKELGKLIKQRAAALRGSLKKKHKKNKTKRTKFT